MKKKFKLGVIGGGFMASAIVNGAILGKRLNIKDVFISDVNETSLEKFSKIGIKTTTDNFQILNSCEFVLLAVKPQNFSSIINENSSFICNKFISIMAGTKKEKIKKLLKNSLVARCMPNTPCSVGNGAVGIDVSDFTDSKDLDFIKGLFDSFSKVVFVKEELLNVVTGISGSAPAYYYLFAKGIIESGVKRGLSFEEAKQLAVNTMIGSGKMLLNSDQSIDELINAVCSKGGTTIEAIKVFNENKINEITDKSIEACINRAIELENL